MTPEEAIEILTPLIREFRPRLNPDERDATQLGIEALKEKLEREKEGTKMTKEKAIEILTLMGTPEFEGHTEDILAARKLGIEALKHLQKQRQYNLAFKYELLPGETEK